MGIAPLIEQLLKLTPAELDARWPRAFGNPLGSGRIREQAADFVVKEISPVNPSGVGEHLWLLVRKTECNTEWVARALARFLARPRRDVGYAGRKDRHAVTEQWFSVRCPSRKAHLEGLSIPGVTVISHAWHDRKLKRGYLQGNRFVIRIRGVDMAPAALEERLNMVTECGVPNYFGLQRFGLGLSNLAQAVRLFEGSDCPGREQRSLALSAARSLIFNEILGARVARRNWATLTAGELANLSGSRSVFLVTQVDEELQSRLRQLDIHPTAPLFGVATRASRASVTNADQSAIDQFPQLRDGLVNAGVELATRPTRVVVTDLSWELEDGDLRVEFSLPPGAFATSVLREVVSV